MATQPNPRMAPYVGRNTGAVTTPHVYIFHPYVLRMPVRSLKLRRRGRRR